MYLEKINETGKLDVWIREMNLSFKARSSERIPYEEIKPEQFEINDNQCVLGLYSDQQELLGGMHLSYDSEYHNIKMAKISRCWISVKCQHTGMGTFLMREAEKIALNEGREMFLLNVANIYIPAVSLYKKVGFKKHKIFANTPNTYYFIQMIKPIGDFEFSRIKRICALIKSVIIFKILYKTNSSPTMINTKVYKRAIQFRKCR